MHLTPKEIDRLLLFLAAELARRRRARGLRLNYPEACALIADEICEGARDGQLRRRADGARRRHPHDGRRASRRRRARSATLQVEAMFFDDGQKLVTVHDADRPRAASRPRRRARRGRHSPTARSSSTPDARRRPSSVANTGDRPVQVGSHFHFFEVNAGAARSIARGRSACASTSPAGTAVRFEPGDEREVDLVAFGGDARGARPQPPDRGRRHRRSPGAARSSAPLTPASRRPERVMGTQDVAAARTPSCSARRRATASGSATRPLGRGRAGPAGAGRRVRVRRRQDAARRARHARRDHRRGGRARLRDHERRADRRRARASSRPTSASRTAASSASARPAIRRSWTASTPGMVVGANTDVRSAEGMIATAGGDRRARPLRLGRPVRGGDLERRHDDDRRRARPGHRRHLLVGHRQPRRACCRPPRPSRSTSASSARARRYAVEPLLEQVRAGAHRPQDPRGLGRDARRSSSRRSTRATSSTSRCRSTPTRSTSPASTSDTMRAIDGRTIHTYHSEGAGGGHAPDIIRVAGEANCLPVLDEPDEPVHRQHVRRAPRHGDGLPPPQPARARGRGVRRVAHPPRDDRRRGRAARPRRDQRRSAPTRRAWAASARRSRAPGRSRRT